jgi:uncharacterized protein
MRRMLDARTGLEVIDPDECRRLLAGDEIGRLAVADGGAPTVVPVNYVVDGDAVVFRTAPGTKLAKARGRGWRSRSTTSTGPAAPAGAWS